METVAEKDTTKLERMMRRLAIEPGSTVLDVGTGTGVSEDDALGGYAVVVGTSAEMSIGVFVGCGLGPQLEVARLEAALLDVEQAGIPDPSHWQALHKALAEARQHARKPFE